MSFFDDDFDIVSVVVVTAILEVTAMIVVLPE